MAGFNKNTLNEICNDLQGHKRDKDALLKMYITDRLNKSLKDYYDELEKSLLYLNNKDEMSVAKKLNKIQEE